MPARPCPVLSGTVRSVRSVRSGLLGPGHWSGPDGPDRTRQGQARLGQRAVPALSGPVRSGPYGPLQCPGPKAPGPDRTGQTGPDRTDRTGQGRAGIFSSPLQLSNDM